MRKSTLITPILLTLTLTGCINYPENTIPQATQIAHQVCGENQWTTEDKSYWPTQKERTLSPNTPQFIYTITCTSTPAHEQARDTLTALLPQATQTSTQTNPYQKTTLANPNPTTEQNWTLIDITTTPTTTTITLRTNNPNP